MAKGKKYYVVWKGHLPGVYDNWNDCLKQTKNYPDAKYKSFSTQDDAHSAFLDGHTAHVGKKSKNTAVDKSINKFSSAIIKNSIAVDAACSGNPGIMEYRGVHTVGAEEIFRQGPFKDGTNNVGEFLALVHGLALLKKNNSQIPIYTDSRTAMAWIRNKKVKTTLEKNNENAVIFDMINRALSWLKNNTYTNQIIKWETKKWGEIPADFGRK